MDEQFNQFDEPTECYLVFKEGTAYEVLYAIFVYYVDDGNYDTFFTMKVPAEFIPVSLLTHCLQERFEEITNTNEFITIEESIELFKK